MRNFCKLSLLMLALNNHCLLAAPITAEMNYWQCTSHDQLNKTWVITNHYKKVALNFAWAHCKKESQFPTSCSLSKTRCTYIYHGMDTTPMWQCTAIDYGAKAWTSDVYPQKDEAALAAKTYCNEKSAKPNTCFINMITCIDVNNETNR